jgi:hypothetical protein
MAASFHCLHIGGGIVIPRISSKEILGESSRNVAGFPQNRFAIRGMTGYHRLMIDLLPIAYVVVTQALRFVMPAQAGIQALMNWMPHRSVFLSTR